MHFNLGKVSHLTNPQTPQVPDASSEILCYNECSDKDGRNLQTVSCVRRVIRRDFEFE